jgi:pimeloyl-ACP methyl ester carboxylesterase
MSTPGVSNVNSAPQAEQTQELEPVYFGPSRELFGCLHAPRGTPRPGSGVVVCPAAGPEYIRCHRSLRVLAAMLARAGYPVLRFDYFATGDSLGEGEEATLARWQRDVNDAVRFMRGRYRTSRLTLLGIRMGAALAVRHLAERGGVDRLVLWDPIVDGRRFVEELQQITAKHEQWLAERHGVRPPSLQADGPLDLFGFRYSSEMIDEMAAVDLLATSAEARAGAYVLDNCEDADTEKLSRHLEGMGLTVELQRFPAAKVWMAEPFQGLLSAESLKLIETWITGESE